MTRIEECEKLLSEWKARESQAKEKGWIGREYDASNIIFGIIRALEIFKRPSNTQMHMDTKPCGKCIQFTESPIDFNYCGYCGRALSQ